MIDLDKLRKASTAIYIAVEEPVAKDISGLLIGAALEIEKLREAVLVLAGPREDAADSDIPHDSPVTIRCQLGDLRRAWAALT